MNVLWLTNSPCSSIERKGGKTIFGGWLTSLEKEITKYNDINLSISYLSNIQESPFTYMNVNYFPIHIGTSVKNRKLRTFIDSHQSFRQKENNALPQILQIIDDIHPDLIHIHGTEELWGIVYKHISNVPIVFSIQGLIAPIKEKLFSGMQLKNVRRFDSIVDYILNNNIRRIHSSFKYRSVRENEYLKNASYIIGRTTWDERCTLALNYNRKYFTVNEILRSPFYNSVWSFKQCKGRKIRIISTFSGAVYKGFETTLQTAHILQSYSKINFEWHIVGYTKDSKWCKVAEIEKKLKISDYPFVFHGRIDANNLAQLLSESDIYVHVSHIENSPNSVCEAMLVGLPTIASFAGGTSSIIKDGEEGILVQDGDPYVLAGNIVYLTQNPDLAMYYSTNAKRTARQRHKPENVYKELLSVYSSILSDFKSNGNKQL